MDMSDHVQTGVPPGYMDVLLLQLLNDIPVMHRPFIKFEGFLIFEDVVNFLCDPVADVLGRIWSR